MVAPSGSGAAAEAAAAAEAVVLVVCLELCTLHMQIDDKPDGFVTDWSIEFKGVKRLDNGGAKGDTRR